jgi:uncharacterized 2Fe-2S/4Fe-4S cluster protein (DUF4445 family)
MEATGQIAIRTDAGGSGFAAGPDGSTLADALASAGFKLNTRCGQKGSCRGCTVHVRRPATGEAEEELLACRVPASSFLAAQVRVPTASLQVRRPAIVSEFAVRVPTGHDPLFASGRPLGIAVDIGTTTVAATLVDLESGDALATASALNAQVSHGDNVVTRINLCREHPGNIGRLRDAFWSETFAELVRWLEAGSGRTVQEVAGIVLAGNTTMLHLAAGVDPSGMGAVPFTPNFVETRRIDPAPCGFSAPMEIVLLPSVSAFVGSDIVAGTICCGFEYEMKPSLYIDVGTNGEILLGGPAGFVACATAAGPAFEGCGLLCGARAGDGVVGRIDLRESPFRPTGKIIGPPSAEPAHGIAGSAYIDFLAEGRRVGLLDENGRFDRARVAASSEWFQEEANGLSMRLGKRHPGLRIGEVDVALLLQAKAAIAAGIETLLARHRMKAGDLDEVLLAGGFGMNLSVANAAACGLLPGIRVDRVVAVGNTSLGGAYLAMLDRSILAEMEAFQGKVESVELNLDEGFEDRFLDHLALP